MALIRADGHVVPLWVPCNREGVGSVSASLLSVRYNLVVESLHLEEEVFNDDGHLSHTVYQMPTRTAEGREWLVEARKYIVRGLAPDLMVASTEILTPGRSTTSTVEALFQAKVQVLSESDGEDAPPPSHSKPIELPEFGTDNLSVVSCLRRLGSLPGAKSALARIDYSTIRSAKVPFLPSEFDGDVLFELPPAPPCTKPTTAKLMVGMDKRFDAHPWCKTKTSNITNDMKLTFRYSLCSGHLKCSNGDCDFLNRPNRVTEINESEWDGHTTSPFVAGGPPPAQSTLVCKICRTPPDCFATCPAKVYYVFGKANMTRACIHLGSHDHPVGYVECRENKMKIMNLVEAHVEKNPTGKSSAIALEASKDYLGEHLLSPIGEPKTLLNDEELNDVFKLFYPLSSAGVKNNITTFKTIGKSGVMDGISALRGCSKWEFVQENKFPGQGAEGDKVFVFKMSEKGPGSGVDLVKRMQPAGDLQDAWIMFDHVKRTKGWTTMGCHVYDSQYCRVMTIAVCDMQSEDERAQSMLWHGLNGVMAKHGIQNVNFKGFMADSAQANWRAVRVIYGNGNAKDEMPNRERTCQFHWATSLKKHTEAHIFGSQLQTQHYTLCKQYRDAKTLEDAEIRYHAIRAWWTSSGATATDGLRHLDLWLAFWHFRYRQWGGYMQLVSVFTSPLTNCFKQCQLSFILILL